MQHYQLCVERNNIPTIYPKKGIPALISNYSEKPSC